MGAAAQEVALAKKVDRYLDPVLTAVCSASFFLLVPMMPGSPVLPVLVGAGLGLYAVRSARRAAAVFYVLVFASIVWQLLGFGLATMVTTAPGVLVAFLLLVPLLFNGSNPRMSPSSMALTFLAVALMLTPAYVLSVPLIAAAVALDGMATVAPTVITYLLTLAPFLLVENALYYGTAGGQGSPPIVFGELTHFAAGIRPALPGLNVFLTGLPSGFVSPQSAQVTAFLTGDSYILVVPLAVFAVVFGLSASFAGILTRLKDRLGVFARLSRGLKTVWPVVVTVTMTAVFSALLLALSSASVGGYQAELGTGTAPAIGMMTGAAGAMGAALSMRAYLDESLTSAAKAREGLSSALEEARRLLEGLRKTAASVDALAPSVGLKVEEGVMEQYSSYLADVARQIDTSGTRALRLWEGEINTRIIPTLGSLPEQIRVKVINEVSTVASMAESLNTTMEHLGVKTRFPVVPEKVASMETEAALAAYSAFTAELKVRVNELYGFYLEAAKALDLLLDKTVSEPPVDPDVLLSTSDYITAMRLLGEEYSMNLHAQYSDELKQKAAALQERVKKMAKVVGEEDLGGFDLGDPAPLESPQLLKKVDALLERLRSDAERAVADSVRLRDMVGTLMPAATTVLKFATLAEIDSLKAVRREARALTPSLEGLAKFVDRAAKVLASHAESGRKDEENLIIIAQYPLAAKLIHGLAAENPVVSLSALPFQPDATSLYAKIYAANDPSARYDEQGEALLISHA